MTKLQPPELPTRSTKYPDGVDGFDVRSTFILLTRETTPHGFEWKQFDTLLTQSGFFLDKTANYQGSINNPDGSIPETIFIAHLDTIGNVPPARIEHVFKDDTVTSNGTTILGADDKAGVTILLYLIHKQVPGFYVFTWGEESGRLGSRALAARYSFAKFKRAIAFDRKGTTSIITRQGGQISCSNEFADALIKEFATHDLAFEKDPTGTFTDTVSFFGEVPECTNISVGYSFAHGTQEEQDLAFLEDLCHAAGRIKWEELPTHQETSVRYPKVEQGSYKTSSYGYQGSYGGSYQGQPYKNYHLYPGTGFPPKAPEAPAPAPKGIASPESKGAKPNAKRPANVPPPWSDAEFEKLADEETLRAAQDDWDLMTDLNDRQTLEVELVEQFFFNYPEGATHALFALMQANPFAARSHLVKLETTTR